MTLWIFILALLIGGIVFVLWPLVQGSTEDDRLQREIALYEARKAELARQSASGEITESQYQSALAEQGRALLALGRQQQNASSEPTPNRTRRRKLAAVLMLVGLPALSLPIYLKVGKPNLPDMPLAARDRAPKGLDLESALQRIEAHLAQNPDDARGYEVVAPVYMKAGRFADAARAYARVISLKGESAERLADLGESLVAEKDGIINQEARQAFEKSIKLDPAAARPRFYLAMAREQDGDKAGALAEFRKIVTELPDGPAKMRVQAEVDRLGGAPQVPPGGEAVANLPPEQRAEMIRSMVEGLEARLNEKGGSAEEWRRLVQARMVLKEKDKALAALEKAKTALAGDAAAGKELEAFARSLGLLP